MENYYEILGVPPTATQEDIQRRYRFLAMAFHPDRFGKSEHIESAEDYMKRVNKAYDVLSDPEKRKRYDSLLMEMSRARPRDYSAYYEASKKADSKSYGKSEDSKTYDKSEYNKTYGKSEDSKSYGKSEDSKSYDKSGYSKSYDKSEDSKSYGKSEDSSNSKSTGSTSERQEEKSSAEQQTQAKTKQGESIGRCSYCRQDKPVRELEFSYAIGLVFYSFDDNRRGYICAECAELIFWKYTAITLWLGWWGLRTFFFSWLYITENIINYIKAWELRKSSDQLSNIAVGWKLAIATAFILIGYLFLPRMLQPNQSSASVGVVAATKTKVEVKNEVIRPTSTPRIYLATSTPSKTENCISWRQVSTANEGEYLCVYGTVNKAYWGGKIFYIAFNKDVSAFRFVALNGYYYKDIENECVLAYGKIKTYLDMPYIEVKENLEGCYSSRIFRREKKVQ